MAQRLAYFSHSDIQALHQASLRLLSETGVEFPSAKSRAIFAEAGYKVVEQRVYISEEQLWAALASAPPAFDIRARRPEASVKIGGPNFALAPTGGAPNILSASGELRSAALDDYRNFARLVQSSPLNMVMTNRVCQVADLPPQQAHLDMLLVDASFTDRALMCCTASAAQCEDSLKMLEIIFGGRRQLMAAPASLNVINVFSPLKYAPDQSEVLALLAAHNQPVAVTNMMMLGATAPMSVPGALALGNAEILAGVVLSQLVQPGAPVIYGSTSCPMDMKSMVAILGAPETLALSRGTIALADFYGLPSRTGGSLTDSFLPDAQAAMDSALVFQNALYGGAHFIFHSFGMTGSYLAASLEKFLLDEEMVHLAVANLSLPEVNEKSIDLELIQARGSRGDYLTAASTVKNFRCFHHSLFLQRLSHDKWSAQGGLDSVQAASLALAERLAVWEKPPMDSALEAELNDFVAGRKKALFG